MVFGYVDLATLTATTFEIRMGQGNAMFGPATVIMPQLKPGSYGPQRIAVGDFNWDGNLDLVVTSDTASSRVEVFLGDGNGAFTTSYDNDILWFSSKEVTVADFNKDGWPDILVVNDFQRDWRVIAGNGDGTFTNWAFGQNRYSRHQIALVPADFDHDQDIDFVTAGDGHITVRINAGNGTFGATWGGIRYSGLNPLIAAVGIDYNKDSYVDLALYGGNQVKLKGNNTAGVFADGGVLNVGGIAGDIKTINFNGDGSTDLIMTSEMNELILLPADGASGFEAAQHVALTFTPAAMAVANVNSDDVQDLVIASLSTNEVKVLTGQPTAVLESLEIVGPSEVVENSQIQYQAIAHYDNSSTRDVTGSADWTVDDETITSIAAGLLITEIIDVPEDITITAQYTEGSNTVEVDKMVSVLTICPSGSALEFDGINDYIDVPDSDSLSIGAGDYTICAWIKPESLGGGTYGQAIVFKAKDNSDKEFIFHQNGGKLSIEVEKNSNNRKAETTTLPVTTNIWQHVAVTFESSSLTPTFYHNGQIQLSISNINALPDQLDDPLCIGRWGGTYNNYYFEGVIDEVAIYNRTLSDQEVQYLMDSYPDDTDPSLVGYWSFDEGEGQVAHDLSNSNNHGQLGSTPEIDTGDPNWVYSDALATICYPPVAVAAGPNEAVLGDSVLLDGSGSFDADGDILTFSWRLISKPSGSIAEITAPNSEQTTFIPDVPGEYTAGLVVSDDYFDSEEDEVNITVISLVDAIEETLGEAGDEISNLDPNTLKNSNMTNALTNKIDEVLVMIDAGLYEDALGKLENDILKKTDGCTNNGEPDKNDWIKTCEEQSVVYPLVAETIEYVRSLMEE
jgi:hypothetical protein